MMINHAAGTPSGSAEVIRLTCPCGRRIRVKRDQAEQRIRCPKCGVRLAVRAREDAAAPPAATSPPASTAPAPPFSRMAEEIESAVHPAAVQTAGTRTLSWSKFRSLTRQVTSCAGISAERTYADLQPCRLALLELGQSRDRRAAALILPCLESSSDLLRQAAAAALGDLEDPAVAGPLVRMLEDSSATVRKAAVISLGKCGHRAAVKPLLRYALSEPHSKFLASESVLKLGERAVPELLDLVSSQETGLALEAIVLLGRLGDKRAVKSLISCAESRSPLLRCHAAEALGKIGDARARGALLSLLEDSDRNVRANAAAALARMPDPNCLVSLVRALVDTDADVRRSAALALGEIGDPRAAEPLARLLDSNDDGLALVAAEALARLRDERALTRLVKLLQVENESIQVKAIAALKRLNSPKAAPALFEALLCQNPLVRQRAVDALGTLGDAEAAERLESVMRSDRATPVRAGAARALGEIADPASVDALIGALGDELNVRCTALGALGAIGSEPALPVLLKAIEDPAPEIRFHAASALGNFKNPQAIEALQSAVADGSEMVQRGATRSLEKLGTPLDRKAAARLRRTKIVRSQLVDVHLAIPALLAVFWADSGRGRAMAGGVLLAVMAGVFLMWPRSSATSASAIPIRGNVQAVAFSPDGTKIALGRTYGLLEIWDPESGKLTSEAAIGGSGDLAFANDSSTLAVVAQEHLRLWKTGENGTGRDLGGHKQGIKLLASAPGGEYVATFDGTGRVLIWKLPAGSAIAGLDIDVRGLNAVDVSPGGQWLASAGARGQVIIWDTATARPVHTFGGWSADVVSVAFSPDGSRLAATGTDGTIRVWDTATGKPLAELKNDARRTASLLRFHPDGNRLAAVTFATVWIWDLSTQQAQALPALNAEVIDALSFSPDGSLLVAGGSEDRLAWIVDVDQSRIVNTLDAK